MIRYLECLISGVGGLLAIYAVFMACGPLIGDGHIIFVVSIGAATMLLFSVPHSPMSQPWSLFGGNLISGAIGVSCARWVPDPTMAAGLAVGLSIIAMHGFKCLHPPGTATALTAVLGGPSIVALGYGFLMVPVLLNLVILFLFAIAFNWLFPWRRYPLALSRVVASGSLPPDDGLSHEAIAHALRQIDTYMDIDEGDLKQIYRLAIEYERGQGANKVR